jgi:cytidine deaminase
VTGADWAALRRAARDAMSRAYAPYSGYAVVGQSGGGRLTHFVCVDGHGEILVPCGRCRQLLYEFGGPEMLLETPAGILPLSEMLPQAFGPDHLTR